MPGRFVDHASFIRFVKAETAARTYLEIGVETGRTLLMPDTSVRLAIGVDPEFAITTPMTSPIQLALFRKTSDDFFAARDYQQLTKRSLDLAFVDGLHWCEFALRDVLNTERLCSRRGTILVHDIVPGSPAEASRDRTTDSWMGDVFRAILALKHFRPDLTITCIGDIPPSGMAVVTGLNPRTAAIDLTAAVHFMMEIDFERDFERLMRPHLVSRRSRAVARLREHFAYAASERRR